MQLTTYSNFDRFIPVVRSVKPQALLSAIIDRGAGSNVKRRGQPFQKGTCFSAIIFLGGNIC
jgi:hypothetical protein